MGAEEFAGRAGAMKLASTRLANLLTLAAFPNAGKRNAGVTDAEGPAENALKVKAVTMESAYWV